MKTEPSELFTAGEPAAAPKDDPRPPGDADRSGARAARGRKAAVSRRRRGQGGSGAALAAALGSTIQLLRWLLIGLVGLYLTSGFTRVGPQEEALVFRLGRLQPTVYPPGFLFALPAPIDRVVRVPTRAQHELVLRSWQPEEREAGAGTAPTPAPGLAAVRQPNFNPALLDPGRSASSLVLAPGLAAVANPAMVSGRGLHPVRDGYTLTADVNVVQGTFAARYRIVDPVAWVRAASEETTNEVIAAACHRAALHALAATRIDDALGAGLSRFREELRRQAQMSLEELKLGIELVALEIQELVPPTATVGAFTDVTSAQVEARTAVEQARTYRAQLMPKAESEAYRIRHTADAAGAELLARAQGETSAFLALLAEHRLAPALVETRLRTEALEEVLPRVKFKTVLPSDSAPLHLYLKGEK